MKVQRKLALAALAGAAATIGARSASAASFDWARGVAGPFAWNDQTNAGETAPSGSPAGNWNVGGTATRVSTFPNASGDVATIPNQTTTSQTINLDQNITVGVFKPGRLDAGGANGAITIATGSAGNGAANTLFFDNGASNSLLEQVNDQTTNSNVNISAPIAIGGNGTLVVSNDTHDPTNLTNTIISGSVRSALASGVQTLINGAARMHSILRRCRSPVSCKMVQPAACSLYQSTPQPRFLRSTIRATATPVVQPSRPARSMWPPTTRSELETSPSPEQVF